MEPFDQFGRDDCPASDLPDAAEEIVGDLRRELLRAPDPLVAARHLDAMASVQVTPGFGRRGLLRSALPWAASIVALASFGGAAAAGALPPAAQRIAAELASVMGVQIPDGRVGWVPGHDGPGNSGDAPGQTGDTPGQSGENPGNSGDAPGQTGENPGNSGDAPGQTGENPGNSEDAPGQTGENPGNSEDAPGQTGENPGNSGDAPGQAGDNPGASSDRGGGPSDG